MNFKDFIVSEEDMAPPMGDPMGGGAPMGDPMMGGDPMGGAPPMDPMMGGMGGAPAGPGGVQPPVQFKPNSVWDVLEKILDGKPVNDEEEKEGDQSGQNNADMLNSPQQQELGMSPSGPEAGVNPLQ